jgi:hypothetical protein
MALRPILLGLGAASALLFGAGSSHAVSFAYDFTSPAAQWGSGDFSLVGSASWVNDTGLPSTPYHRLRLTPSAGGQVGNAWVNTTPVDASQAWNAEFTWQITFEGGGGADGLGFHLQETGTGANTFFNGAGLLANSFLSIGIDTWNNGGANGDNYDFALEIHKNGSQLAEIDLGGLGGVADDVYQLVMSYDGAGTLTLNVINTANLNQTGNLNFSVDLSDLDAATVGWSANTGGATENHDIRTFSGTFVPEPATALLLGLGLAGLAYGGRSRA